MEHAEHHKRELKFFLIFLFVFSIVFIMSIINLSRGVSLFNLGLPYLLENWIVLILSLLAILKVLFSIIKH